MSANSNGHHENLQVQIIDETKVMVLKDVFTMENITNWPFMWELMYLDSHFHSKWDLKCILSNNMAIISSY